MASTSRPFPEISVVVPCWRSERTVGRCIASLRAQGAAPPFEVVVVDSSPDEGTAIAARAANPPGPGELDLVLDRAADRLFPGEARNRGVGHARAPWILFLDSDCVAADDLLTTAARLRGSGPVVVGGSIALPEGAPASARIRHLLEFKESLPGVPARDTWQIPSACMLVDRAVFDLHGGFPATRASEDWLFDWDLWTAGHPMRFEPALRVCHLTPPGWAAMARYLRVLGRASGAARRRGGLPGQAIVRHPWLSAALPFARTARALAWCARHAPRDFGFLLLAWPAYFAMASVWAAGFRQGLVERGPRPLARAEGRT
ncbi:MAG: glycosyltransferase family 2 protein [Alphaproteobacteria bacterium]